MSQQFDTIDRFRLEVETDPVGLVNLVQNPSGELGGWAWVTPLAGSAMTARRNPSRLRLTWASQPVGGPMYCRTELMPVMAGEYIAGSWNSHSGSSALGFRPRFEWYDSTQALLSSSPQGPWLNDSGTGQVGPVEIPAGAAFAALRLDFYSSAANAAPPGVGEWTLSRVTVCTAPVSTDLDASRHNMIANPSFETTTTGWAYNTVFSTYDVGAATSVSTRAVSGTKSLQGVIPASTKGTALLTNATTVVGRWYVFSASIWVEAGTPDVFLAGLFAASSAPITTKGSWVRAEVRFQATATTTSVGVVSQAGTAGRYWMDAMMLEESTSTGTAGDYFDGSTTPPSGWTYAWTGAAHASESTGITSNLQYAEPIQFRDITTTTTSCQIEREALNLGTLNAVIRDALLDPSRDALLRTGRRVRALALADSGEWQPLLVGKLDNAVVDYELKDPSIPERKRVRIELTATDDLNTLGNQERPQGVGTIPELPFVLEACGVPWSVNGSGNQVATANVVTTSSGQTAVDQIAVTRDSRQGLAWIDRRGVVQVWDRGSLSTAAVATFNEARYSGFDATFDPQDCINEVNIVLRRINLASGETVEVNHGPYRDQASIRKYGARSSTFTIQGHPDTAGAMSAYAQEVLSANSIPRHRVNTLSYAAQDATAFALAGHATVFRDLCDLVRVQNASIGFDRTLRVKKLKHSIEPKKWLITLDFGEPGSVESPSLVPPVQSAASYATEARGRITITPTAAGANTSASVVFAQAFQSAPNISVGAFTSVPAVVDVSFTAVTPTGMTIVLRRSDSKTPTTIHWSAAPATQ